MFSPLAQYAVSAARSVASNEDTPHVVRVVGCLNQDRSNKWLLARAGEPVVTNTQATSMAELKAVAANPLGVKTLELLGIEVFNPRRYGGQKVAVKGVLIQKAGNGRVNVTSLQTLAVACD
jgi:hypothetical protein